MTKYQRLKESCHAALKDGNIEKCLELLEENLEREGDSAVQKEYNEYLNYCQRFRTLEREHRTQQLEPGEYRRERNKITDALLAFLNTLEPHHVSLMRRVHDRIVVFTPRTELSDTQRLFPEAFFSHVEVLYYKTPVSEEFRNPDVVIFDDSDDHGLDVRPLMSRCQKDFPKAHFLYFGEDNPFRDSKDPEGQDIWNRCNNANTRFTLHARLQELLMYRKIYGF
jgi:Effector-associated domain 11